MFFKLSLPTARSTDDISKACFLTSGNYFLSYRITKYYRKYTWTTQKALVGCMWPVGWEPLLYWKRPQYRLDRAILDPMMVNRNIPVSKHTALLSTSRCLSILLCVTTDCSPSRYMPLFALLQCESLVRLLVIGSLSFLLLLLFLLVLLASQLTLVSTYKQRSTSQGRILRPPILFCKSHREPILSRITMICKMVLKVN
jgi:hypothetical protein